MAIARLWRTLSHLKPSQLGYLFVRRVLRHPRSVAAPKQVDLRSNLKPLKLVPAAPVVFDGPLRVRFLNVERLIDEEIPWHEAGLSKLWRYNLHYFEWHRQAALDAGLRDRLIADWLVRNPPGVGDGWEPYPLSLRLVNWAALLSASPVQTNPQREWVESFAHQAAWLAASVEYHVQANHLFENAKALVFAGLVLDGPFGKLLLEKGLALTLREARAQHLSDGGHFERSPMYHDIVLRGLLELLAAARDHSALFPSAWVADISEIAERALKWSLMMRMPDQEIALFNDAAFGVAPSWSDIQDFADRYCGLAGIDSSSTSSPLLVLPASGYFGAILDQERLVIDCGDLGPAYQPGHGHCDLLSFECVHQGQRLFIGAGNYDYLDSPERGYARSSAARNTVSLENDEQSELWGAFRVGRRALVGAAEARLVQGERFSFKGEYRGFSENKVCHRRMINYRAGAELEINDELNAPTAVNASTRLRIGPQFQLRHEHGTFTVVDAQGQGVASIDHYGMERVDIEQGWYFPEFGLKQKIEVVLGQITVPTTRLFGWRISFN
ncbi:MAG: alginate lyase family protein [Pseudomonadota bacterium]